MNREEYLLTIKKHLGRAYNLSEDKIDIMMPRFLGMLSTYLLRLEELSRQNDLKELGHAGHALKGALLNLGLPNLAQYALLIEQKGKALDKKIDYSQVISKLKSEIEIFIE